MLATLQDLAAQGTNIVTLGQYLQPTKEHLPIVRYVHPDEFAEFKMLGEAMGFKHVEAGPLVRSSYHAFEQNRIGYLANFSFATSARALTSYFGAAVDQSVKGTARPPRTTVGITWSKPLWDFAE